MAHVFLVRVPKQLEHQVICRFHFQWCDPPPEYFWCSAETLVKCVSAHSAATTFASPRGKKKIGNWAEQPKKSSVQKPDLKLSGTVGCIKSSQLEHAHGLEQPSAASSPSAPTGHRSSESTRDLLSTWYCNFCDETLVANLVKNQTIGLDKETSGVMSQKTSESQMLQVAANTSICNLASSFTLKALWTCHLCSIFMYKQFWKKWQTWHYTSRRKNLHNLTSSIHRKNNRLLRVHFWNFGRVGLLPTTPVIIPE